MAPCLKHPSAKAANGLPVTISILFAMRPDPGEPILVPIPLPIKHPDAKSLGRVFRIQLMPKGGMMAHVEPGEALRLHRGANLGGFILLGLDALQEHPVDCGRLVGIRTHELG